MDRYIILSVPKRCTGMENVGNYNDIKNILHSNGPGGYLFYFSTSYRIFSTISYAYVYAFPCHPDTQDVMVLMATTLNMERVAFAEFSILYNDITWRYINTSAT